MERRRLERGVARRICGYQRENLPLDDVQSASKGLIQIAPDFCGVFEHI